MFRSPSRTSTKTGVAPVWTITFAVAGQVIGVVITSSPGPTPSATSARCMRGGAGGDGEHVLRLEVLGHPLLEQRGAGPGRQPARAERLGDGLDLLLADRRRLEAELAVSRVVIRRRSVLRPAARRARASASSRLVAGGEDRAGAVGAAPERPEGWPGRAVDAHLAHAVDARAASSTPFDRRAARPSGRDEEDDAGAADETLVLRQHLRSSRARSRARGRSGRRRSRARRARRRGRRRAARRARSRAARRGRAGAACTSARSGSRAPRPQRARRRRSLCCFDTSSLGQACASATPNAGGSAVSRSVTVSGWKTPSTEKAFTVTSGPSTSSSTRTCRCARRRAPPRSPPASSSSSATSESPRWPCRSGALTTQGTRAAPSSSARLRHARLREALALPLLRRRERRRRRVDRVRQPEPLARRAPRSRPASRRPARRSRRPLRAREPVDRRLVLGRDERALVGVRGSPGARGIAVDRDHEEPPLARRARGGRAAPGRRLGRGDACRGRGPPATRPRSRGTRRPSARARPRSSSARASR